MTSGTTNTPANRSRARTLELFVLVFLVALGGTSVVAASWARDIAQPRAILLGADRGISVLVTAGATRVLIVNGTDPAALGNAVSAARHPGLDRIDIMIVSGNAAAAGLVPQAVELLNPREVITVGGTGSLEGTSIVPRKVIENSTVVELPEGVTISIEVWPAADGENDDVTWAAAIERGDASLYWVADREQLMQETLPATTDVTVIGRGAPAADSPFPNTTAIVAAGESITGPDLRTVALNSLGPYVETRRIFAGEELPIDLDPEGITSISGATFAGSPVAAPG